MAGRSYAPDIFIGIVGALALGYFINSNTSVTTSSSVDDSTGGGPDDYGNGSTLGAWAHAIASFENVNPSYNNPGGINENGDAGRTSNGIAMYSSWSVGYNRLLSILQSYIDKNPSMTLDEATRKYAFGPNAGQLNAQDSAVLANYQATVSQQLGLAGSTPIAWIGGA
jgi:hypothetical protein